MTDKHIPASKLLALQQHNDLNPLYENGGDYILYDDLRAIIEQAKAEKKEPVGYTTMESIKDAFTAGEAVFGQKISGLREVALYTRPAPKTYTEHDIDVAIGSVDWANTSWQQAAVEAKKLVMRFVGSQVTVEPKWIPVRDKLPEIDSDVLILSADHDWVILGEYSGEFYRYSEASGTERVMNVRFWSPIPILPKFLQEPIDKMTGGGK